MRRGVRGPRTGSAILLGWLVLTALAAPAGAAVAPDPTSSASLAPTPAASAAVPLPSASATAPALRQVDAGGVLYVSGLRTVYHSSPDPLGGTLHVELVVRNAYSKVVDASASFGARNLLGMDLGGDSSVAVRGIEPGEVRVIAVDVRGVGQWGVFHVDATLTPPTEVGGVKLSPLERDRWVLAPPLHLVALVAIVGVVAWFLGHYRLVRGAAAARPAPDRGVQTPVVAR
ncbi:hypothetical protein ACPPVS_01770 [Cellulomonas sp. McL0617]|uniref:hypothetical protein n=1 Tax=Cellulomonas sp. McL0617 TaxID=3415675 RepID=UPI003CED4721